MKSCKDFLALFASFVILSALGVGYFVMPLVENDENQVVLSVDSEDVDDYSPILTGLAVSDREFELGQSTVLTATVKGHDLKEDRVYLFWSFSTEDAKSKESYEVAGMRGEIADFYKMELTVDPTVAGVYDATVTVVDENGQSRVVNFKGLFTVM